MNLGLTYLGATTRFGNGWHRSCFPLPLGLFSSRLGGRSLLQLANALVRDL